MRTHSGRRLCHLLVLFALAVTAARAQITPVTFTVTATYQADDNYGYTKNQAYTFVYTLGNSFTDSDSHRFSNDSNEWVQEEVGDDRVWATVGGNGLTGTFSNPQGTGVPGDLTPWSVIKVYEDMDFSQLTLIAGNDSGVDIGLSTKDGLYLLGKMQVTLTFAAPNIFAYSNAYSEPNAYFAAYSGSYAVSGQVATENPTWTTMAVFSVTGLTISAAPVPEPSTYAAILGLTALGFVAFCRRRNIA